VSCSAPFAQATRIVTYEPFRMLDVLELRGVSRFGLLGVGATSLVRSTHCCVENARYQSFINVSGDGSSIGVPF